MIAMDSLVLRTATAADADALQRPAALDSQVATAGPHLLAELDGQAVAALSRTDGSVVADPFSRTDTIGALLRRPPGPERRPAPPARRAADRRPRAPGVPPRAAALPPGLTHGCPGEARRRPA